jgi:predicted DNA-binding protein
MKKTVLRDIIEAVISEEERYSLTEDVLAWKLVVTAIDKNC